MENYALTLYKDLLKDKPISLHKFLSYRQEEPRITSFINHIMPYLFTDDEIRDMFFRNYLN